VAKATPRPTVVVRPPPKPKLKKKNRWPIWGGFGHPMAFGGDPATPKAQTKKISLASRGGLATSYGLPATNFCFIILILIYFLNINLLFLFFY
jgi:hypothetical protein